MILYKLNRIDLWIARPFIKAKYITLVNLLADEVLMPEYLTVRDVSDELSGWARAWLDDPIARAGRPPISPPCGIASPGPALLSAPPAASSVGCASTPPALRPRLPCFAGPMGRLHSKRTSLSCQTRWIETPWVVPAAHHRCSARLRTFASSRSKPGKSSDCAPSESAWSGSG